MTVPDEPLHESAPLAWRLAPGLCRKDPATGEDCSWYHGIWQILRVMGLASSATQRTEFYQRSLQAACAGSETPRILICGAADYAMLATVIAAFRNTSARPAITVIDVCQTPLHMNRWYAEREACRMEIVCSDVLDWQAPESFDAICTDGFFSRFASSRRPALVARWRGLLRQGGRVITTNRLHPGSTSERIGFSTARAQKFRDAVLRAIPEQERTLQIDPQELLRRADLYAEKHDTYPLGSSEEIRGLFEGAGFGIDTLSETSRASEQPERTSGSSKPASAPVQMYLVAAMDSGPRPRK